jgi:hypothetical protein
VIILQHSKEALKNAYSSFASCLIQKHIADGDVRELQEAVADLLHSWENIL